MLPDGVSTNIGYVSDEPARLVLPRLDVGLLKSALEEFDHVPLAAAPLPLATKFSGLSCMSKARKIAPLFWSMPIEMTLWASAGVPPDMPLTYCTSGRLQTCHEPVVVPLSSRRATAAW